MAALGFFSFDFVEYYDVCEITLFIAIVGATLSRLSVLKPQDHNR